MPNVESEGASIKRLHGCGMTMILSWLAGAKSLTTAESARYTPYFHSLEQGLHLGIWDIAKEA
jgi:hypothetical protein